MANIKLAYANAAAIAISLAPGGVGLAPSATVGRESAAVNNSVNLYVDAMVYLAVKLAAGTPGPGAALEVYLAMSHDGANFTDNATGADASLTMRAPSNLVVPSPIGTIWTPASGALTWKGFIPSVAAAFGGFLPPYWSIVLVNNTGIALDATESNHTKQYVGVYATVA
jgi:hypothetical protein